MIKIVKLGVLFLKSLLVKGNRVESFVVEQGIETTDRLVDVKLNYDGTIIELWFDNEDYCNQEIIYIKDVKRN